MVWLVVAGLVSGIVSGLGIGGGTVLIPTLCIFFGFTQQEAQSLNLIYFIPTAIIAILTHMKQGNIEKKLVLKLVLFGLVFAAIGSFLAIRINNEVLQKIFGAFLLVMGTMEILRKKEKDISKSEAREWT